MTFALIEAERAQHPVSLLCSVLGVTRGGFYAWKRRGRFYAWKRRGRSERSLADEQLSTLIAKVHKESLETYGVPRIHAELADDYGIRVGRKRVARLMRALGIAGVSRRGKRRYKTTVPAKETSAAPDLVRRSFQAPGPNRLWVADITYAPPNKPVLRRPLEPGQYTSLAFGKTMQDAGVMPSIGAAATPSITPSPRASSRRSRPSCSTGTRSAATTKRDSRSSTGSKASTTPGAGTPRSDNAAPRSTKRS